MSFEFEYFGEFEVTFATNLWYESGDLVDSFDEKTRGQNSHVFKVSSVFSIYPYVSNICPVSQIVFSTLQIYAK